MIIRSVVIAAALIGLTASAFEELPKDDAQQQIMRTTDHLTTALSLCSSIARFTEVREKVIALKSDKITNTAKIELFCIVSEQGCLAVSIEDKIECVAQTLLAKEASLPVEPFARTWIELRKKIYRTAPAEELTNSVAWLLQHKPTGLDKDDRRYLNRIAFRLKKFETKESRFSIIKDLAAAEESGEDLLQILATVEELIETPQAAKAPRQGKSDNSIKPPKPPE